MAGLESGECVPPSPASCVAGVPPKHWGFEAEPLEVAIFFFLEPIQGTLGTSRMVSDASNVV